VKRQRFPVRFRGEEIFYVFLLSYEDPYDEIHEMDDTETSCMPSPPQITFGYEIGDFNAIDKDIERLIKAKNTGRLYDSQDFELYCNSWLHKQKLKQVLALKQG
jgi:hypothetical protein